MTLIYELDQLKKENQELKKQINDLRNQMAQQQKNELREVVGDTDPQNSQFLND
jgi:cell division protein FtsB